MFCNHAYFVREITDWEDEEYEFQCKCRKCGKLTIFGMIERHFPVTRIGKRSLFPAHMVPQPSDSPDEDGGNGPDPQQGP